MRRERRELLPEEKNPDIFIYNMDCVDFMKQIPDLCINLTVTSPPYDNLRNYEGYSFDCVSVARELYRVTQIGGVVVWVVGDATVDGSETGTSFKQAIMFKEIGFNIHDTMIWKKQNAPLSHNRYEQEFEYMFIFSKGKPKTFNGIKDKKNKHFGCLVGGTKRDVGSGELRPLSGHKKGSKISEYGLRTNIWEIHNRGEKNGHPAIYPEQLAKDHIISWSNEGDIVLDPFIGSGTTALEAKKNNRHFYGSEISEKYCAIAKQRLKATTRSLF